MIESAAVLITVTDAIAVAIAALVVNALVTYGVVKATLYFLAEGIREAKASAALAHDRIDSFLLERNR